jgi:hypothetical protein
MRQAGQEQEAHKITKRVYQRHDLGRQSAPRSTDGLFARPPFAPDAF